MENEVMAVLNSYALPVILMSLVTLGIVGVLKTPLKVKLKNAEKYSQFISVAVMLGTIGVIVGVVAVYRIYIAHEPFVAAATLKDIGSVFLLTQTFYMMYKKYGRKGLVSLVKAAISWLKGRAAAKKENGALSEATAAVLDMIEVSLDDIMQSAGCPLLTEDQKKSLHEQFALNLIKKTSTVASGTANEESTT